MRLPAGTITFFFTDIDGSTRFWEENPEVMSVALRRHDELLHQIVERHGGVVFKTVGDAFHVAFEDAPTALKAATEAQIALSNELWPAATPIRVRMVLHTGEAEIRDSDYFGRTLNRASRILATANGGQIVSSQSTLDQLGNGLPDGISFIDLGEHRIRDLSESERLYQVAHDSLSDRFRPIRTLETLKTPNNLPQPATSFIGRKSEIDDIRTQLEAGRLVTLVGTGGCGKTRLSLEVSASLLNEFRDGVWFIGLDAIQSGEFATAAVASAFQISEEHGIPLADTLIAALRSRQILVVMDNCEHVLADVSKLVERMYHACPNAKFLCSSREALIIPGERTYRVPSLSLPSESIGEHDDLTEKESVRLFIDRASSARQSFVADDITLPKIASICIRLDGVPLAIELAAARVRSLSVFEIHDRLHDVFALLKGGSRNAMPRQQTLQALIDWSFDLLSAPEREAFGWLSVFTGGWSLDAAEEMLTGLPCCSEIDPIDLLTALVDKSLVTVNESGGAYRYGMLATIRQYAFDRLVESGGSRAAHAKHRSVMLHLVEAGFAKARGPQAIEWLTKYQLELENLRTAINSALTDRDAAQALELTGELGWFWYSRRHIAEGRQLIGRALDIPGGAEASSHRMRALSSAFWLAHVTDDTDQAMAYVDMLGEQALIANDMPFLSVTSNYKGILARFHREDYRTARAHFEEALRIARELKDEAGMRSILTNLASTTICLGDYGAAKDQLSEALEIAIRKNEAEGTAICSFELATVFYELTEFDQARDHFMTARAIVEKAELSARELDILNWSSLMAVDTGDLASALTGFRRALEIATENKSEYRSAWSKAGLGRALAEMGERLQARKLLREALSYYVSKDDHLGKTDCLYGYCALEDGPFAASILGAAWTIRKNHAQAISPNDRRRYQAYADRLKSVLGTPGFEQAFTVGSRCPSEMVELVLEPQMSEDISQIERKIRIGC